MVQGIPDVYRQETDFLYKKKKKKHALNLN